jgi:TolB-like protein
MTDRRQRRCVQRAAALLLLGWLTLACGTAGALEIPIRKPPAPKPDKESGKPVVVVFDFTSPYDGDRMGKFIAKNVWAKLDRTGKCVLIERTDLVDVVSQAEFVAEFDAKPAKLLSFAAKKFGATHAVWGKVEKAGEAKSSTEVPLKILARAAGGEAKDKLSLDLSIRVQNQREIQLATHDIVRRLLKLARPKLVDEGPVLAVFPFDSPDDGALGAKVADDVRARLADSGKCRLAPRKHVRKICREHRFTVRFDSPPAKVMKFALYRLGVTHTVYGKVRRRGGKVEVLGRIVRAAGLGREVIDEGPFEVPPGKDIGVATGKLVHMVLENVRFDAGVGPEDEKRWVEGPNLVKNPGFEAGNTHPKFWEPLGKDYHHGCVKWVASPEGKGKCIKFDIPKSIAATYGAAYYSEPISIKDGEVYRFSVRVRSDGPQVKIFLKHYKYFPPGPNEKTGQWRETRRAPMNCRGTKGEWQTYVRPFRPHRDDRFDPTITKVELYAYWPKGVVYFDDVVLKKLRDRKQEE